MKYLFILFLLVFELSYSQSIKFDEVEGLLEMDSLQVRNYFNKNSNWVLIHESGKSKQVNGELQYDSKRKNKLGQSVINITFRFNENPKIRRVSLIILEDKTYIQFRKSINSKGYIQTSIFNEEPDEFGNETKVEFYKNNENFLQLGESNLKSVKNGLQSNHDVNTVSIWKQNDPHPDFKNNTFEKHLQRHSK